MNRAALKRVGVELTLIAGVLFLAHEFGLVPIENRIVNSSSELAGFEHEQQVWGVVSPQRERAAGERLEDLTRTAEELNALGRDFVDPSAMYSRYQSAASRLQVRLERIDPNSGAFGQSPKGRVDSVGFTIGVSGPYAQVAEFISVLQHEFPLTAIEAVRMAPDPQNGPDGEGVIATIKTRHFGVAQPIELADADEEGGA